MSRALRSGVRTARAGAVLAAAVAAAALSACSTWPAGLPEPLPLADAPPALLAACPPADALFSRGTRTDADAERRRLEVVLQWYSRCREAALYPAPRRAWKDLR